MAVKKERREKSNIRFRRKPPLPIQMRILGVDTSNIGRIRSRQFAGDFPGAGQGRFPASAHRRLHRIGAHLTGYRRVRRLASCAGFGRSWTSLGDDYAVRQGVLL